MSTPSFLESHVSQIAAIQLLQRLGFAFLSPEEIAVERRGKLGHVLLEKRSRHPAPPLRASLALSELCS